MKPLFSDEEKAQAVRTFLIACHHKKAEINDYGEITKYLNTDRIVLLYPVVKSGSSQYDVHGRFVASHDIYTDQDAQDYYEALVSIVSDTAVLNTTEETVKKANNQLFHFIHIMQNANHISMDNKVQMIAPYDWQNLFTSFDERLTDMQRLIDKGDKDTIEVLKTLLQYMKENKTLLKTLCADSEELFGKGKRQ